jgi:nucleoside-diphosphate-sugar epimerase
MTGRKGIAVQSRTPMPTAFVTGGSGFIGGALVRRLVADGVGVRALPRSDASAQAVRAAGAEPVRGDLGDPRAMALGADGCDVAFHCAARVDDWGPPEEFEAVNVDGTRRALDACAQAGVPRFVHAGTEAAVLAGRPLVLADERAPLRFDSPVAYCATKARAEEAVPAARRTGFRTVVVRPRLVWGPGDIVFRDVVTRLLAIQGPQPPRRSVPRRVAGALAAVAEAAWRALPLPGRPPLTRLAVWLSGLEATIDISRARTELGYAPVRTVDEGLAELADEARRGQHR